MYRFMVSILLVVFTCTGAAAESSVWKAQKGSSIIYLGGTCHILRASDYPLPPEFARAYKAAEIVVFETDIDRLHDPATQQRLLLKARYTDGSTVDRHLSVRTYGELKAYCAANGIPLEMFRQLKPSMLMLSLTLMELEKLGVSQQGVDEFFHGLATSDGKTIERLETVDTQLNYLVTMADDNEEDFVAYSLRDMETLKQQFDALVNAWRKGDADKLAELMLAELKTRQPKLYKKLITDRNRNWLPMIEKTGRTKFVLVGAAHLVGADGIIEALRMKGYKVDKL